MDFHPVSKIFPLMSKAEFTRLKEDIEANGLREPIWLHPDGRIIDGRNRYLACLDVGVELKTVVWDEAVHGDLISFVLSHNLHRRQLTQKQRVLLAARIADYRRGDRDAQICASLTQKDAARITHCSRRSVQSACKVLKCGIPKLIELVENEQVSASSAEYVAGEPEDKQAEIVSRGSKGVVEFAKASRVAAREDVLSNHDSEAAAPASQDHDPQAGTRPLTVQSVPEAVVPAATYSVIVAEPPWHDLGATAAREHAPGKPRLMKPEAIKEIVRAHALNWQDPDCALCIRTNRYYLKDAIAALEAAGFDLLPVQLSPRAGLSCEGDPAAPHNIILIGVRGSTAALSGQGWMSWLNSCRGAEPETHLDVNNLARHLSGGPILEVSWTDSGAGGSRG